MSGPTTALLIQDPMAVLLSAAGIRAAMAIQEGYQVSAELTAQHQSEHDKLLMLQHIATEESQQAIQQQLLRAESEFTHLLQLGQRIGFDERISAGRPIRGSTMDDAINYLRALQSYNAEIKSILLTNAALQTGHEAWNELATQSLPDFSNINESEPNAPPVSAVQRLLARINHLGDIPDNIQQLANQLTNTLPAERAELLQNELRMQIQLLLEQHQQQAVQEASALILRQSLKDLGYQVEEFSDTLFIEGGVAHFRRHGWGDYMVRLRINEKTNSVNFNVVRAVHDANNERSVLDHLAEDRWCAEFPTLLKAMEARGLGLNVTRRLEGGELPVQLVDANQLPAFGESEERRVAQPLLAKELK